MLTPAELGYRMPPEWGPHQATWISWPHKEASWPGKIQTIFPVCAQMVATIARSETVHINVNDEAMEDHVRKHLDAVNASGDIRIHHFPTNDAWCRDHGAIFVKRRLPGLGEHPPLAAIDWDYNAWGHKYPPHDLDNQIPSRMAETLGVPRFEGGMVLEGGSIEVDGTGLLLTSEACLLNPNRNPHLSREQIEVKLKDMLGVEKVLWLGDGIVGDDTDGHIDDIARFVADGTVLTAVEDDPDDENHEILAENLKRLEKMTTLDGRNLTVITLPMPPAVIYDDQRLPASYANFYITNKSILLPTYRDKKDEEAAEILGRCFPDREVVGIDCTDLIWGLGAFHCLTQQIPAP